MTMQDAARTQNLPGAGRQRQVFLCNQRELANAPFRANCSIAYAPQAAHRMRNVRSSGTSRRSSAPPSVGLAWVCSPMPFAPTDRYTEGLPQRFGREGDVGPDHDAVVLAVDQIAVERRIGRDRVTATDVACQSLTTSPNPEASDCPENHSKPPELGGRGAELRRGFHSRFPQVRRRLWLWNAVPQPKSQATVHPAHIERKLLPLTDCTHIGCQQGVSGSHGYSLQCRPCPGAEKRRSRAQTRNSPHSHATPPRDIVRVSGVRVLLRHRLPGQVSPGPRARDLLVP